MKTEQLPGSAPSDADDYERRLDHLVDTKGYSYDDARRELGEPPYETYASARVAVRHPMGRAASREVVRRASRRRSGNGPQYGEEEGVGYPDGKPHYTQPTVTLSDEQIARNARNIALIRAQLSEKNKNG